MHKAVAVGLVVVMAISLVVAGTIWAQDDSGDETGVAWFGVQFTESDAGVVVTRVVKDSPAEAAGLAAGDVFVSFDGEAVESGNALSEMVLAHVPGDVVTIVVSRAGTELTLEVTLGDTSDYGGTTTGGRDNDNRGERGDGAMSMEMDNVSMVERLLNVELEAVDEGYEVIALSTARPSRDGAPADAAPADVPADPAPADPNLATPEAAPDAASVPEDVESLFLVGDVIISINGVSIDDLDLTTLMPTVQEPSDTTTQTEAQTLTVIVLRDGEEITLEVPVSWGRMGGLGGHDNFNGEGAMPDQNFDPNSAPNGGPNGGGNGGPGGGNGGGSGGGQNPGNGAPAPDTSGVQTLAPLNFVVSALA